MVSRGIYQSSKDEQQPRRVDDVRSEHILGRNDCLKDANGLQNGTEWPIGWATIMVLEKAKYTMPHV